MSIRIPIDRLSNESKTQITDDLHIENPNKKSWVYTFDVDEKEDKVYLPYAYARTRLSLKPPKRTSFTSTNTLFTGTLRPHQKEIREEAITQLNNNGSILLSLHVGWGKSIFGIYLATKLRFKTLIIVTKLMLAPQWKKEIESFTNAKCQFIKSKDAMDDTCDFYIMNAINIPKRDRSFYSDIGTIIADEVHLIVAEKMFTSFFRLTPRYLIGLSATPYRPDGLNVLLDIYFGTYKIIEKLYKKHIVYTIRTGFKIPYEMQWNGKMDWNSVLTNQAMHSERNEMILDIVQRYHHRYFLILCKRVEQGQYLHDRLLERNENVTNLLGSKKEFDEQARIIVATSQKCGVGFSHKRLNTLIIASDMEEYFIQYLGRVFRTPDVQPVVFDFVDNLPILNRHYMTRKRTYKQSGGQVHEIHHLRMLPDID